jgi:hypothetical protein
MSVAARLPLACLPAFAGDLAQDQGPAAIEDCLRHAGRLADLTPKRRAARWSPPVRGRGWWLITWSGIELYSDPKIEQILHRGGRSFEKSLEEIHSKLELEEFYTNKVRCCAAIANAAANKGDISCDEALPKDLDDWRWTMEFVLGPYHCGVDLKRLSAKEYVPFINRDPPVLCRYGVGGLIGNHRRAHRSTKN